MPFPPKPEAEVAFEEAYLAEHPHVDPPAAALPFHKHVMVKVAWTHKSMSFGRPIPSNGSENIDNHEWEIFSTSHVGIVDNNVYYWGMFVEGIGAFNVMVLAENVRNLTEKEKEYWSNRKMGMYGSHSGKLSYTISLPEIK